jgi:hypothetical protein
MGDPPDRAPSSPEEADIDELPSEFTPPAQPAGPSLEEEIAAITSLDEEPDDPPGTKES